jgi:predicted site-specific integrase-resolvase
MRIDKNHLEFFVTPEQAALQLRVDLDSIYQLADEGKLRAAVMTDGNVGISQLSINEMLPKESLPEYQVNAGLLGVPISINEAGRKYKLNTSTLTRWMQRGLIRQLGNDGRKTLLDEADVAYCAGVYRQNSGQGKWAFDDAGRPYKR